MLKPSSKKSVLVPLDLDFQSLSDPELFMRFAPQYFDTVVLIEGVVAQYGLHVKFLQKLIAGYAKLKYGLKDDDRPENAASAEIFGRLREAGKDTLLLVAHDRTMPSDQIEASAEEHGLAVTHLNWLDLTKPMRTIR